MRRALVILGLLLAAVPAVAQTIVLRTPRVQPDGTINFGDDGTHALRSNLIPLTITHTLATLGLSVTGNQSVTGNLTVGGTGGFTGAVSAGGLQQPLSTPASATAACTPGQFSDDANYRYVCTATNTWRSAPLGAFQSSGIRVLLNTLVASNSASLQDTTSMTSTYSEYEVDCEGVTTASNATPLNLFVQQGGAFATSGYLDGTSRISNGSAGVVTSGSGMVLANSMSNLTNNYAGQLRFSNISSSAPTRITGIGSFRNGTPAAESDIYGTVPPPAPITGFQISAGSGNLASGQCKVYGFN